MKSVPDVSYEIKDMEDKFDDDTESIITNERYVYIIYQKHYNCKDRDCKPAVCHDTVDLIGSCKFLFAAL